MSIYYSKPVKRSLWAEMWRRVLRSAGRADKLSAGTTAWWDDVSARTHR